MKKQTWLYGIALGATLMLTVPSCGGGQAGAGAGSMAQQAAPFQTMKVTVGDREIETNYSATIRGRQDIEIYPQVAGRLTKVLVNEGDAVRQGQALFIIDQVPYQAAVAQANASVQAAKAAVATAKLQYEAKQRLFNEKIISQIELETARNAYQSAEASLAQANALALNARNNLSYTTVTSPANGRVGTLPYRQGALVSTAMPSPLTTVSDNSEMYVYFSLGESELLELIRKYGSLEAAIKYFGDVQLRLSDGSIYEEKGKVESASGVIDRATGASSLRARFANPKHLLSSGSTGSVIITHTYNNAMVIPQSATVQLQDKVMVYKVVDGKATSAVISVQPINNGTEYIVTDGLIVGETIVSDGAGMVREGMPIASAEAKAKPNK